ncbi:MAG: hypothetical protein RL198_529 [Actinomycetota bacterium]
MSNTSGSGYTEEQERQYAMFTHLSMIIFQFLGPLIGYLVLKDKSEFLKQQTASALNFGISITIYSFAAWILTTVTFGLLFILPLAVGVAALVLVILGGLAANRGELYKYPLSITFIK